MASSKAFLILVAMAAAIVAPTIATDFVVGDDKGWGLDFDYQKWAEGKIFRVGDNLVFNYPATKHNVVPVNGTLFQSCSSPENGKTFTSGSDTIPLKTEGRKWYICTVPNHCQDHMMKLVITVWSDSYIAPTPSPTQESAANGVVAPSLMIAALVSLVAMIMA